MKDCANGEVQAILSKFTMEFCNRNIVYVSSQANHLTIAMREKSFDFVVSGAEETERKK